MGPVGWVPGLPLWLCDAQQPGKAVVGKMKGEDRFRAAILVAAARRDAVAAPSGGKVRQDDPAVVAAEEPLVGGFGTVKPGRIMAGGKGDCGRLDSGLCFERLLIEGMRCAGMAEGFRSDRAQSATRAGLLRVDPVEGVETGGNPRVAPQCQATFDQRLRQTRIVITQHGLEP